MAEHDYAPKQLAEDLEALFNTQPHTPEEIGDWNERVRVIEDRLTQGRRGTHYAIPPHVWRWVNDVHIRLKDPEYDRWLTRRFLQDVPHSGNLMTSNVDIGAPSFVDLSRGAASTPTCTTNGDVPIVLKGDAAAPSSSASQQRDGSTDQRRGFSKYPSSKGHCE